MSPLIIPFWAGKQQIVLTLSSSIPCLTFHTRTHTNTHTRTHTHLRLERLQTTVNDMYCWQCGFQSKASGEGCKPRAQSMLMHNSWGRQKVFWVSHFLYFCERSELMAKSRCRCRTWGIYTQSAGIGIIGVQNEKGEKKNSRVNFLLRRSDVKRAVITITIMIKCWNWMCSKATFSESRPASGVRREHWLRLHVSFLSYEAYQFGNIRKCYASYYTVPSKAIGPLRAYLHIN